MIESLKMLLEEDGLRPQVIKSCVEVLEGELNKKKGVTGMLIRKGFAGVSKLKEGKMIEKSVNMLLNDFVGALEPYYQTYRQMDESNRGDFSDFLAQQDEVVTESLLEVTDRRRESANNKVLTLAYDNMRKIAVNNVKEAVPALGQMIQGYMLEECAA